MQREFTATVYVIHKGKLLLVPHPKFNKWMPPGGHVEPNETPQEAAVREVLEETGVHVELVCDSSLKLSTSEAHTLPRPYLCLLQQVPAFGDKPAHQHFDMVFLGRPLTLEPSIEGARWFDLHEIHALNPPEDVFHDAKQLMLSLLS